MKARSSEKIIYLGIGLFSLLGVLLTAFLIYKASRLSDNSLSSIDFSMQRSSSISAGLQDESSPSVSEQESLNALLTLDFGTASKEAQRLATYSGIPDSKMTALDFLIKASKENSFTLEYEDKPFGAFVKAVSGIINKRNLLWIFYYNGRVSPISPDKQVLKPGDHVQFRYSSSN